MVAPRNLAVPAQPASEIGSPAGRTSARSLKPRIAPESAARACSQLLGCGPVRIDYPGGLSRSSVRAVGAAGTYIVTQRKHVARAALEAGVMRELRAAGAPVPAVLAFDGEWMIQEDLGHQRLSMVCGVGDRAVSGLRLARAAQALLLCQRAAQTAGLAARVAPIGATQQWLAGLLATPGRIAARLDLPDPDVGVAIAPEQLMPKRQTFVKWDARPGNAMLVGAAGDGGGVGWIDWEHCGTRDALDDLAWLLCDEFLPDDAGLESALINRFLPLFALQSGRAPHEALVYLSRFGTLHTCVRLLLVLERKGDGPWWNAQDCERADRVGVTLQAAQHLCLRGARWSRRWPGGERMERFFAAAGQRLREAILEPIPAQETLVPA